MGNLTMLFVLCHALTLLATSQAETTDCQFPKRWECRSTCQSTCDSLEPISADSSHSTCGCYCPNDSVLHEDKCIQLRKCPVGCGLKVSEAKKHKQQLDISKFLNRTKKVLHCWWNITAKPPYQVNLEFLEFNIIKGIDVVELDDGTNNFLNLTGVEAAGKSYVSKNSYFFIRLIATANQKGRKLHAFYQEVEVLPSNATYTCASGNAIPLNELCSNNIGCDWDEELSSISNIDQQKRNLICERCPDIDHCGWGCPTYFESLNNEQCLERSRYLDDDDDQPSLLSPAKNPPLGTDTNSILDNLGNTFGFFCNVNNNFKQLRSEFLFDDVADCDGEEDLCFDSPHFNYNNSHALVLALNQTRCFECLQRDNHVIIPRHHVCDGVFDCPDLSDECLCEEQVDMEICKEIKLKGFDNVPEQKSNPCLPGDVHCGDGTCIDRSHVCDGLADCPDLRDERDCSHFPLCETYGSEDVTHGIVCSCDDGEATGSSLATTCGRLGECKRPTLSTMASSLSEGPVWPPKGPGGLVVHSKAYVASRPDLNKRVVIPCIQLPCCPYKKDESNEDENESYASRKILQFSEPFVKVSQVQNGSMLLCGTGSSNIEESEVCDSVEGLQLSYAGYKCDWKIDCANGEDEMGCPGRFYCTDGPTLYVTRRKVNDGVKDCSDGSDECSSDSASDEALSSKSQYIKEPWIKALAWFMGTMSFVGNVIVIIGESRKVNKVLKRRSSSPQRINHMLVLNLAVADGMIGVYLLMVATLSVIYDEGFCLEFLNWHMTPMCLAMGCLVVIGSQTSVMTLLLLTAFRLFGVIKPFAASRRPKVSTVVSLIVSIWFIAFFLALLPFCPKLQYMFADTAILSQKGFFKSVQVDFDKAKHVVKSIMTYSSNYENVTNEVFHRIDAASSWSDLQSVLTPADAKTHLNVTTYFGYYADNNLCIPRLLVTPSDNAWRYTLAMITFNFVAFLFVAFAYGFIIRDSTIGARLQGSIVSAEVTEMQYRVLRLVATDFCCWVPLCVIVYLRFAGVPFPNHTYAVAAVVLLPINSALNPMLYSRFLDRFFSKIKTHVSSSISMAESENMLQTTNKITTSSSAKSDTVVITGYTKKQTD